MRPVAHRAVVARLQTAWSVGMKIKVIEKSMTYLRRGY
jgi:tetrahydromethanopterin S-methyltransferase subunit C